MVEPGFSALHVGATIARLLTKAIQNPEETICEVIEEYINTEKGKEGLQNIAGKLSERWKCTNITINTIDNFIILKLEGVVDESCDLLANDAKLLYDVINGVLDESNPLVKDESILVVLYFVNSLLKRKADPISLNNMLESIVITYNKIEKFVEVKVPMTEKIVSKVKEVLGGEK